MPFGYIFAACAAAMVISLVMFHLMPEKPLRGRAEAETPAAID